MGVLVPVGSVRHLEISEGVHGHAGTGLGLGFLAGAAVGAAIGAAVEPDELLGRGINVLAGVVIGGVGGGLIGLGVGASIRTERWRPIGPQDVGASLFRASEPQLAFGLSLSF